MPEESEVGSSGHPSVSTQSQREGPGVLGEGRPREVRCTRGERERALQDRGRARARLRRRETVGVIVVGPEGALAQGGRETG